jgi:integrase
MARPRKNDTHLPPCVYPRHGAYWHVKSNKWTRLGVTFEEALIAYARIIDAPRGGMPDLIDTVLKHIGPNLSKATIAQYDTAARKLKKKLQQFAPDQVKPKHVAAIKVALASTPNMANRCLSLLRQVFAYALEQQLVDSNPAVGIKRHLEAKRGRLIGMDEYAGVYAKAGPRLQIIMDLLIRTGQRVGDVLRIRRADLTEEGIRFVQQKTGHTVQGVHNGGVKLVVPWTPELRAVVARAKTLHGNIRALTLLHNRRGKPPDYRTVKLQWDTACAAAGVADAHLHDLRAVALTAARRQGLNATRLAGHSSPAQTERYLRDREEPLASGPSFGILDSLIDNAKK